MNGQQRVLAAYDGSAPARRALVRAADVTAPGDTLNVINVMPEPGVSASLVPPAELYEQAALLEEAGRLLAARGVRARTIAAVGHPASEILAAAERESADLIVIARRSGHASHLLGSVSSRVVRSAHCDVLVVHDREGP